MMRNKDFIIIVIEALPIYYFGVSFLGFHLTFLGH